MGRRFNYTDGIKGIPKPVQIGPDVFIIHPDKTIEKIVHFTIQSHSPTPFITVLSMSLKDADIADVETLKTMKSTASKFEKPLINELIRQLVGSGEPIADVLMAADDIIKHQNSKGDDSINGI